MCVSPRKASGSGAVTVGESTEPRKPSARNYRAVLIGGGGGGIGARRGSASLLCPSRDGRRGGGAALPPSGELNRRRKNGELFGLPFDTSRPGPGGGSPPPPHRPPPGQPDRAGFHLFPPFPSVNTLPVFPTTCCFSHAFTALIDVAFRNNIQILLKIPHCPRKEKRGEGGGVGWGGRREKKKKPHRKKTPSQKQNRDPARNLSVSIRQGHTRCELRHAMCFIST